MELFQKEQHILLTEERVIEIITFYSKINVSQNKSL